MRLPRIKSFVKNGARSQYHSKTYVDAAIVIVVLVVMHDVSQEKEAMNDAIGFLLNADGQVLKCRARAATQGSIARAGNNPATSDLPNMQTSEPQGAARPADTRQVGEYQKKAIAYSFRNLVQTCAEPTLNMGYLTHV